MTRLEISATNVDGNRAVVGSERDDPTGRREIDRRAFELLRRPEVVRVDVMRTDRVAMTGRRSYR